MEKSKAKTKTIYKSSETGEIVSKEFAARNPSTTYKTVVPSKVKSKSAEAEAAARQIGGEKK